MLISNARGGIHNSEWYTMALLQVELPETLHPEQRQTGHFIRRTQSICPECNRILPSTVFEREGKVFMSKTCPEHGETEELYFGSYDMYQKFATYWSEGKGTHAPNVPIDSCACPANCGLCSNHLSHTGLANIIVTNRCDLTCWYCFFYVKKGLEGAYVYEPEESLGGTIRLRKLPEGRPRCCPGPDSYQISE